MCPDKVSAVNYLLVYISGYSDVLYCCISHYLLVCHCNMCELLNLKRLHFLSNFMSVNKVVRLLWRYHFSYHANSSYVEPHSVFTPNKYIPRVVIWVTGDMLLLWWKTPTLNVYLKGKQLPVLVKYFSEDVCFLGIRRKILVVPHKPKNARKLCFGMHQCLTPSGGGVICDKIGT